MTTPVFCASTGSNTSPYETWAKAATTFATAIAQASTAGDIVAVDAASPPADIAATTTWTFAADIFVIASTNSGTATITPTTMGATTWLGYSASAAYGITLAGAFKVKMYGLTFRAGTAGSAVAMSMSGTDGAAYEFENCYFWANASSSARITFGGGGSSQNSITRLISPTFRFSSAGGGLTVGGAVEIQGGSVSSAGTAPTTLFAVAIRLVSMRWLDGDLSFVTGTLVGSQADNANDFHFIRPKLGSGVLPLATQTPANKSSGRVYIYNGASDGTDGQFAYYDALGSIVTDTGLKYTAGAAGMSWKVTTTANASKTSPFTSPWVNLYNSATSSVTPRLEILRDGSATAYKDSEVYAEFSAKVTSGFMQGTYYTDRQSLTDLAAGTTGANQAAGTDTWDGENATHWAGKIDSGAALTPAEPGHIMGRVCVALASVTDLYLDPQIRT